MVRLKRGENIDKFRDISPKFTYQQRYEREESFFPHIVDIMIQYQRNFVDLSLISHGYIRVINPKPLKYFNCSVSFTLAVQAQVLNHENFRCGTQTTPLQSLYRFPINFSDAGQFFSPLLSPLPPCHLSFSHLFLFF